MITQETIWNAVGDRVIEGSDTIVNCTSGSITDRTEIENIARLIAAAPELLEALKELMKRTVIIAESLAIDASDPVWAYIEDSSDAIAKATKN